MVTAAEKKCFALLANRKALIFAKPAMMDILFLLSQVNVATKLSFPMGVQTVETILINVANVILTTFHSTKTATVV